MIYDCVVVGAGPAGITASIYLKRANLNCLLIEKETPGGQVSKSSTIANYPGFKEVTGSFLASKFYEQIKALDIPYKYGNVTDIIIEEDYKILKLEEEEIKTKAVILAVGRKPKSLEKQNFNKYEGNGISYCSICDGALYKNCDVAIVGGGNSALEEALYLSDICKTVTILNRSDSLRGDKVLVDKILQKNNIKTLYKTEIVKFNGEDNKLSSLDLLVNSKSKSIDVKACFIFIGYEPATLFLKKLDILDEKGYVIVNDKFETAINNIYAAGDIVKKEAYQIVTATSDGALAALSCIKNLG